MDITYKREMKHNYLIIEPEEIFPDSYEIHMMIANCIEGLLKFHVKQTDDKKSFYYEITSRQPLARLLDFHNIEAEEFRCLIMGIGKTLGRMESFLLSENQILLEPDYLYVEPDGFEVGLCLVPGKQGDFPSDMTRLLQYLLGKVNHQDKECVVLAYGLYQESLKENYGMDDLLRLLNKKSEVAAEPEVQQEAELENDNRNFYLNNHDEEKTEKNPEGNMGKRKTRDWRKIFFVFVAAAMGGPLAVWLLFGVNGITECWYLLVAFDFMSALLAVATFTKTPMKWEEKAERREEKAERREESHRWQMVFEENGNEEEKEEEPEARKDQEFIASTADGNTVLLTEASQMAGVRCLRSMDHETEDIGIAYAPFIIGKQEGLVDYVLSKDTVSRIHVKIGREGETYCITDLNSTNGTTVRGKQLEMNETTVLNQGDEVYIANIGFIFT